MNYVSVEVLRHASNLLWHMHEVGGPKCGWQVDLGDAPCGVVAEYLVADGTRVSAGGDIEAAPLWRCREHLELELGEPAGEQPIFQRVRGPERPPA